MKRADLKKIIKPLVKECIHESLLEEGLLSGVISEVVKGINVQPIMREQHTSAPQPTSSHDTARIQEVRKRMDEDKKELLNSFKKETFNGINVFEGTEPLSNYEAGATKSQRGGALTGIDPQDPGVDISGIMALGGKNWKALLG
jgi:hypothetical protein